MQYFESAERQYLQNKPDAAIKGFEGYVREFPSGLHALQANFYLAQLYFSKNQKSQSVPHYEYVVDRGKNEYTEQSLARLSQLYLDDQNTNKAIPLLKRLENESNVSQNITYAQSNLMKIYYEMKDYSETISYAEKVLSAKGVDNRIKSDAHIMIARSSMQTGDENRAKTAYAEVRKVATGGLAAEALYYDAYFKHKEDKYDASNQAVQNLAKEFGGL